MKKRTLVLVGLFLIMAFQDQYPFVAQTLSLLDFHSVTPIAQESRSLPFSLPLSTATTIRFECSGLVASKTGNKIGADRITFSHNPRSVGGQNENFLATICFLPSDLPGEYTGMVYAYSLSATENTPPLPFLLKVRILPWIKIETASPQSLLLIKESLSLTGSDLQTREPIKLLLASNAPWRLYLRVGNCESFTPAKTPCFPLQIRIGKTIKAEDFSEILRPNDRHQLVAFGPPTVGGNGLTPANYWTELYVTASISNWHDYPTGIHTYPFFFCGETVDY